MKNKVLPHTNNQQLFVQLPVYLNEQLLLSIILSSVIVVHTLNTHTPHKEQKEAAAVSAYLKADNTARTHALSLGTAVRDFRTHVRF